METQERRHEGEGGVKMEQRLETHRLRRAWKSKEVSPPESPEGTQPCGHLVLGGEPRVNQVSPPKGKCIVPIPH